MPLVKRDLPATASPAVPQRSAQELLRDLSSADPSLRRSAARHLGDYPEAAAALCEAVETEPLEAVREAIFTALIRIGSKAVAAGLMPFLRSEDVGLRNAATEALKTMPNALGEQVDEIFAGPTDVRIFGVEILGALAHPNSPHWLLRVVEDDPELNVCAAAVDALAECGDQDAIVPLRRLLERFPNEPFLEFAVETALTRIART